MATSSERGRQARRLFSTLGPTYDRVGATLSLGQDPRWRRFLVSRLPARGPGEEVLDVATGTGLVAERLLEGGFEVTGLDQSPEMLAQAHRRFGGRVRLVEASADALPFADASFDHLTFTYLLRYVDDPAATLSELARVVTMPFLHANRVVDALEVKAECRTMSYADRVAALCPARREYVTAAPQASAVESRRRATASAMTAEPVRVVMVWMAARASGS